ncbi:dihydroorotate dehydrogenase (quinone) [Halorhodospira abdelmalekii]|uniref:quinone-dependent dihydroorotate dehydrogenase n=1 Tax=Halorhodospira abdelmalekii TaxID=421629 RepID=UPI0019066B50|nr:quinone-dependent dihydroorotate dehydrogenase [Halorhodospira abdelmalekii]MBK1733831.1 dihydroorotate dehydrogenase (quinone) [Halorhodospira abdelmalekii]
MYYSLLRPLLFQLEPERAHTVGLNLARIGTRLGVAASARRERVVPRRIMGLEFPNPVGLAAGFDKDGRYLDVIARLGFGFVELGTVTPRPQPGNPPPRLFRLPHQEGLINRMGFNNGGAGALVRNLERGRRNGFRGVVGINIGKNRETPPQRAADDYACALETVYPVADYVTINLSSPNTPGLRALQREAVILRGLLYRLRNERRRLEQAYDKYVPLLIKLAPDWGPGELPRTLDLLLEYGLDGIVATNTTVSREGLVAEASVREEGGLSGRPLRERAEEVLEQIAAHTQGAVTLMGVGGLSSEHDVMRRFQAGADMVQLYTGLVYRGPELIAEAIRAANAVRRTGTRARPRPPAGLLLTGPEGVGNSEARQGLQGPRRLAGPPLSAA